MVLFVYFFKNRKIIPKANIFNFPWTILKKVNNTNFFKPCFCWSFPKCVVNPKKAMLGESVSTGTQLNLLTFCSKSHLIVSVCFIFRKSAGCLVAKSLLSHHVMFYFAPKECYCCCLPLTEHIQYELYQETPCLICIVKKQTNFKSYSMLKITRWCF